MIAPWPARCCRPPCLRFRPNHLSSQVWGGREGGGASKPLHSAGKVVERVNLAHARTRAHARGFCLPQLPCPRLPPGRREAAAHRARDSALRRILLLPIRTSELAWRHADLRVSLEAAAAAGTAGIGTLRVGALGLHQRPSSDARCLDPPSMLLRRSPRCGTSAGEPLTAEGADQVHRLRNIVLASLARQRRSMPHSWSSTSFNRPCSRTPFPSLASSVRAPAYPASPLDEPCTHRHGIHQGLLVRLCLQVQLILFHVDPLSFEM